MRRAVFGVGCVGIALSFSNPALAQVTQDGTLNTTVNQAGNTFTILDGTVRGGNLFHSFGQFSIPTSGGANFDIRNTPGISTIFSRVTGGSASSIDGTIRTLLNGNPTTTPVSLFLLNPNGILFGANARLQISGSFVGATAEGIRFNDGTEFSATNATEPPLLTMSAPIGLQFGQVPGNLSIQGKGTQLATLNLQANQGFLLAGNNIQLSQARIRTAGGGRVELAGVAGAGTVELAPYSSTFRLNVPASMPRANVTIASIKEEDSSIRVDGAPAGSIAITAQNLYLTRSWMQARVNGNSAPDASPGNINLDVSETIEQVGGLITTRVSTGFSGTAGNITVNTGTLKMSGGAQFTASLRGTGAAGAININARNLVSMAGYDVEEDFQTLLSSRVAETGRGNAGSITVNAPTISVRQGGSIQASTDGAGNGGSITLTTNHLELLDGGNLFTSTTKGGQAGTITVNARDRVTIAGADPTLAGRDLDPVFKGNGASSGIYVATFEGSTGAGGSIDMRTADVLVQDGGQISGVTAGTGAAGTISINASNAVEVRGVSSVDNTLSSISASSRSGASGDGGNLSITANQVNLRDRGTISSSAASFARAGDVSLTANRLTLGEQSQITSSNSGIGNAGAVKLTIRDDVSADNSTISTTTVDGKGGEIILTANQIDLRNATRIDSSTTGKGNAGEIKLTANQVRLNQSQLDSQSSSQGNAGTLSIFAPVITLDQGSKFSTAATEAGQAGSVVVRSQFVTLRNTSEITSRSSGTGNGGTINIVADRLNLQNSSLNAQTASGEGGNIFLALNNLLSLNDQSFLSAEAGGTGNGGNINIQSDLIVGLRNSDMIANAFQGRGGNINITTQAIFGLASRNLLDPRSTPTNDITASSQFSTNGTVQITTLGVDPNSGLVELAEDLVDPSQRIAQGCSAEQSSRFVMTGRGGMAINPLETVSHAPAVWSDIRDLSGTSRSTAVVQPSEQPTTLVEASNWQRNSQTGKVELIAAKPLQAQFDSTCAP